MIGSTLRGQGTALRIPRCRATRLTVWWRYTTLRNDSCSGLGLEVQRAAVREFLNGGDWQLVGEFTEIESGKQNDRPNLAEALAACRLHRATW
jgi:DNA invertase Pin-like site-specific DNA recombinase